MSGMPAKPEAKPETPQQRDGATAEAGGGGSAAREAYSFVCLSCGHGWEQEYVIEHRVDPTAPGGPPLVSYYAAGRRVPSPLTHPVCPDCDGHRVRVMRYGLVSAVERARG